MKFSKNTLALAVMTATVSLAQTSPVLAETATESTYKKYQPTLMNQVTVTAARSEKQLKDVAGSVAVVTDEQMEKELVNDINDLVRYEPGVAVGTDGYRGGSEGFNIRGMEGNRVKIMVDGVDQAQQFTVGPGEYIRSQRNFVDVETLKAVEVVKGPASSLYGSDAIGGIVAFETKDPSDLLKGSGDETVASVKAAYSSANKGFIETLSLANRSGDLETLLIYTRRDNQETKTHGGADIYGSARGESNPSDTGLNNILAKAQYQINDYHRVGITTEYQEAKTDTDLMTMTPEGTKGKDNTQRTRVGIFHEWDAGLTAFDTMQWQLDLQKSQTTMETKRPAYTFVNPPEHGGGSTDYPSRLNDYQYAENSIQASAQFDKNLSLAGKEHQLIYGFNISHTDVSNTSTEYNLDDNTSKDKSYIPEVNARKYGLYLQDEISLNDRWMVSPGIRYDKYENKPESSANSLENSSGDKVTARLGTVYQFSDNFSGFAQFSQGYKAPGLLETYYTYDSWEVLLANPDLKPEESDSYELGIRGDGRLSSYEVTGFYNKYNNFIDMQSVGTVNGKDAYQYQNISKAEIKGVELRGQLWLDEAVNAPVGTTLRGSVAYADGENKEDGEKLNSVAPLTAVIGLGYDDISGNYGGELALTLVKGKSGSDVSDSELSDGTAQFNPAGYGILDLTAYYVPVEDITLRAGVFNITDKKYWHLDDVRGRNTEYTGLDRYTQPGRNYSVSVKWDI